MDALRTSPRPPAASELVADQLRMAIQQGRYLPGDRFPPERELSELLGVSRTTLREAGRLLEAEGLVFARRGRAGGLVVQEHRIPPEEARRLLKERMQFVNMIFDYRVAIETATVRLAAARRTKADLSTLRRMLGEMDAIMDMRAVGPRVIPLWKSADHRFHLQVAKAARNTLLEEGVVKAHTAMYQPINAVFDELHTYMNDPHKPLVDAIELKDSEAAAEITTRYIEESRTAVTHYVRTGRSFQPGSPRHNGR